MSYLWTTGGGYGTTTVVPSSSSSSPNLWSIPRPIPSFHFRNSRKSMEQERRRSLRDHSIETRSSTASRVFCISDSMSAGSSSPRRRLRPLTTLKRFLSHSGGGGGGSLKKEDGVIPPKGSILNRRKFRSQSLADAEDCSITQGVFCSSSTLQSQRFTCS